MATKPWFFAAAALMLVTACSGQHSGMQTMACESQPGLERVCGLQNPEDMVYFSASEEIIFSQFGSLTEAHPGKLSALSTTTLQARDLAISPDASFGSWGDPQCRPLELATISPHGLDLSMRSDGSWQLLVVNHGGRESVEMFEVINPEGGAALVYKGCVVPPDEAFFNDIVALPGSDSFLVTQMMPHPKLLGGKLAYLKLPLQMNTGYVMQWSRAEGFSRLPGTDAALANGISLSADGNTFYLNDFFGGQIRIFDLATLTQTGSLAIAHADNSAWSSRGELLFAAHTGSFFESIQCNHSPGLNCVQGFKIIAYNPITDTQRELMAHQAGQIATATVALGVGDYLYLGTYAGDRITRVPYPAAD